MPRELSPQEIAERSLIKTYRKTIWNPFIAAVKRYELVSPGDHIAVCISGGKDSVVLAKLMQELQNMGYTTLEVECLRRGFIPVTITDRCGMGFASAYRRHRDEIWRWQA